MGSPKKIKCPPDTQKWLPKAEKIPKQKRNPAWPKPKRLNLRLLPKVEKIAESLQVVGHRELLLKVRKVRGAREALGPLGQRVRNQVLPLPNRNQRPKKLVKPSQKLYKIIIKKESPNPKVEFSMSSMVTVGLLMKSRSLKVLLLRRLKNYRRKKRSKMVLRTQNLKLNQRVYLHWDLDLRLKTSVVKSR